jgi:SAM-dependent methyltransferase
VEAGERLAALAELFDPPTFRRLDSLGLGLGWRCWEVGAGSPSVPAHLADRVGLEGRVVATDVDTGWMEGPADADATPSSGFEVLRHDVGKDGPPPGGPFDLVHARLVLVHVPERTAALATMVRSLRPGGWCMIEDADPELQPLTCLDETGPEQVLANRLRRGFRTLMAERGADLAFGRTLPRLLREAGLVDVNAEGSFPVTSGAATVLELATIQQIRGALVARGLATGDEIERHLVAVRSGRLDFATSPMISAWGRVRET